jgi:hypothetical protein
MWARYMAPMPMCMWLIRQLANTPLQRLMDPGEDIGGAAMYLVSDEACYIVGHPREPSVR